MSSQAAGGLEDRLKVFPPGRLDAETERRLRQLSRDLDRLARRDGETGEVYLHEPSLRAMLNKHSKPNFAAGYLKMMRHAPDGHKIRESRAGGRDTVVPFVEAARTAGVASAGDTPEAVGLSPDSSLEDARQAFQARVPHLPDSMFDPDVVDRIGKAVNRLDSAETGEAPAETRTGADFWDYFGEVATCFGTKAGIWWEIAVIAFLWALAIIPDPEPVTRVIAAIIFAGIWVLAWLLWSLVYCLVAALFG